jgi:hypothetical protein
MADNSKIVKNLFYYLEKHLFGADSDRRPRILDKSAPLIELIDERSEVHNERADRKEGGFRNFFFDGNRNALKARHLHSDRYNLGSGDGGQKALESFERFEVARVAIAVPERMKNFLKFIE